MRIQHSAPVTDEDLDVLNARSILGPFTWKWISRCDVIALRGDRRDADLMFYAQQTRLTMMCRNLDPSYLDTNGCIAVRGGYNVGVMVRA